MTQQDSDLQLFKIIVGVAWIDGKIQPEEQAHLQQLAESKSIESHPDIKPLLSGLKKVSQAECSCWISAYLGSNPDPDKLSHLLEEISAVVYSDGDMDSAEAKLLNDVQNRMANPSRSLNARIIGKIQAVYQQLTAMGT